MKSNSIKMFIHAVLLLSSAQWFSACVPEENYWFASAPDEGYRPVYGSVEHKEVKWLLPQAVKSPGKIYVYGPYLLVNEIKKGIHVFDNADPSQPEPLGFIQLLGNTDMAIKDNVLYADHMGNLVALSIGQFNNIQEAGKLPLQNWDLGVPPPRGYRFECVDQSKGLVIGWKKVENLNSDCYAF